jgi:integrase
VAGRIFRYGVATGRCKRDPSADLRGALVAPVAKPRAAVTDPAGIGALVRAIDGYVGYSPLPRLALKLLLLTAARPGELRHAEWSEFDIEGAVWRIPAGRMKMRKPHAIPLSRQALAILAELRVLTGHGRLLLPNTLNPERPVSENTLQGALLRAGYERGEVTTHGFRSAFSTHANESGLWSADAIERSLAHSDPDAVRGIYHRGQHWAERAKLMAWWGDELDRLRDLGQVVTLPARKSA